MTKISDLITGFPAPALDGTEGLHLARDLAGTPGSVGATVEQLRDYVIGSPKQLTNFTAALKSGLYYYDENTATGAPGTEAAYACIAEVTQYSTGAVGILAMRLTSTAANQRVWFGLRTGATGAITWTELYGRHNLLGTVSQSGGLPTGAVIERGSNANGEYTRFADGTQICMHYLTTSASAETTWTFPVAFSASSYRLSGMGNFAALASRTPRVTNKTTTSLDLSVFNSADARVVSGIDLTAIGRWF